MRVNHVGRRRRTVSSGRYRTSGKQRERPPRGKRSEERLTAKQRWQLIQLLVSGSLFVLLVAATWFLPGGTGRLNTFLTGAMERNMDVQAVFSAVGRAFAGEKTTGGELYQAVFGDSELEDAPAWMADLQSAAAWNELRKYRGEAVPAEMGLAEEEELASLESAAYVLYSRQNLPENVSMEQAVLGFEYGQPVRGSISSGFGYRDHPTEGDARFHYGVDLAADRGTEVCCFADGSVTAVGESSSYGKYCIVTHEGGYRTLYAHCSRVTASSGASVQKGEKIAEVGETGMATGPHLHFELQREDLYLNPVYYLEKI